jgi:D-3-phosphoglycerate dehydrogenase
MTHEATDRHGAAREPFTIWSERPIPTELVALLLPDARAYGAPGLQGTDPLRGIESADGVIASSRIRYDAAVFDRASHLRVIARTGTGIDNVAIDEATRRGIVVCNVPDGPTVSTAEHAIALLLAVAKRLKICDRSLTAGNWDIFNEHDALELDSTTLGIIGLGKIGRRVAAVAQALGMSVLVWDPHLTANEITASGARRAGSLDELMSSCHAVSIHAPLTRETHGLVGRRLIALMRPGAILINTARGGLVDEHALLDALDAGALGGVGLDVFAHEPLPADSPLLRRDDVVVTPHVAAATTASRERLWRSAISDALRCLRGERPHNVVNPTALANGERMRREAAGG